MRAQITLFGVTIAFVPADQDCRAERRECARLRSSGPITLREARFVDLQIPIDYLPTGGVGLSRCICAQIVRCWRPQLGFRSAWLDDSLPWRPTQVI
jgi:hypothetical protein